MPTNANVFNSRVTSEALEEKFRQVFPAQGGAELVQDLFASGVIQPVVDFSSVAEGSVLPENLQTAWDFATGQQSTANTTDTVINNTGFWKVRSYYSAEQNPALDATASISITDGLSTKKIAQIRLDGGTTLNTDVELIDLVVFLRAGDSLTQTTNSGEVYLDTFYRQIADVNGTLVNPLGFTFS